jgi:hypothetical protein
VLASSGTRQDVSRKGLLVGVHREVSSPGALAVRPIPYKARAWQRLRSCFKNVTSAGVAWRTVATKSSGTILNSVKLAPKGLAPRMGRVTTAAYKGVHEDSEPLCNALRQAQQFLRQLLSEGRALVALRDSIGAESL